MAQYFTDFSEYAAGSPPSDWTTRWHGADGAQTWNVIDTPPAGSTGGKAIEHNSNGESNRSMLSWDDIDADANRDDIEILCKMRSDTSDTHILRLLARGSGTDTTENGYVSSTNLGADTAYETAYVNGTGQTPSQAAKTLNIDTWYWVRYRINGTTVQLRIWEDGTSEPGTWDVDTTRTDISGVGWAGLGGGGLGIQYFDVFGVGTNGDSAPSEPVEASAFFDITDMPADFGNMETASIEVRTRSVDSLGPLKLYAQLFQSDESTSLSDEVVCARAPIGYVSFDGDGDYVATVDDPSFDFSPDIDVRCLAYINALGTDYDHLVTRWFGVATDNMFTFNRTSTAAGGASSSSLRFFWQDAGLTLNNQESDAGIAVIGQWRWYRVTMDGDDGGGNRVITFYYSDDPPDTDPDNVTWTQHSQHTIGTTTTLNTGNQAIEVGHASALSGSQSMNGRIAYAEVRNAIGGTKVVNPDWRWATPGTDDLGNTWSLGNDASWVDGDGSFANYVATLTGLNTSAGKSVWDAARLRLRWSSV